MTRSFQTIFNLLALSIIIFGSVDVFYRIVRGKLTTVHKAKVIMPFLPEVKEHRRPLLDDFKEIIERDLFGTTKKEEVKKEEEKPVEEKVVEVLEPTSLKVDLLGTVAGDSQSAVAVIKDAGKRKQHFYRVGDSVQDAIVKEIRRGRVIVRVGDKDEILRMEEKTGSKTKPKPATRVPKQKETSRKLDRADIRGSLKNINKLLSEVRIRPHFKGGKPDGLSLTRIKADSVFVKLGLKNGDVLQGVDGRSIKRPDDILSLYKKLKSGSRISLEITRKGKQKTVNYRFE